MKKSKPSRGSANASAVVSLDRMRFAAKVRATRGVLGWSQTKLGQMAGLSQRSIYRLELGGVDVKRSTMLALETVFRDAGIAFEDSANGSVKITVTARAVSAGAIIPH